MPSSIYLEGFVSPCDTCLKKNLDSSEYDAEYPEPVGRYVKQYCPKAFLLSYLEGLSQSVSKWNISEDWIKAVAHPTNNPIMSVPSSSGASPSPPDGSKYAYVQVYGDILKIKGGIPVIDVNRNKAFKGTPVLPEETVLLTCTGPYRLEGTPAEQKQDGFVTYGSEVLVCQEGGEPAYFKALVDPMGIGSPSKDDTKSLVAGTFKSCGNANTWSISNVFNYVPSYSGNASFASSASSIVRSDQRPRGSGGTGLNYKLEDVKLGDACWMRAAKSCIGLTEGGDREELKKRLGFNPSTAWCCGFVNACLKQAGIEGTGLLYPYSYTEPAASGRFQKVWSPGDSFDNVKTGDIVIVYVATTNSKSHIGFVNEIKDHRGSKHVFMLGGNQDNSANIWGVPVSEVRAIVRPIEKPNSPQCSNGKTDWTWDYSAKPKVPAGVG